MDLEGRTFLTVPNHKLQDKYEFGTLTSFAYKVRQEGALSLSTASGMRFITILYCIVFVCRMC